METRMRALIVLPLVALAACASTSPKDLEKMSTVDVCYMGMMEPEKQAAVDAEMARRKEYCQDHTAELKKMADLEMRAGGSGPQGTDAARSAPGMGGASSNTGGGMGGGRY
jgi:hypothetical protein